MAVEKLSVKEGDTVLIPCRIKNGFFSDEIMIRIDDPEIETPIVGYVPKRTIRTVKGKPYVMVHVTQRPTKEIARILISGEIVSPTNPVSVPSNWLAKRMVTSDSK